MASKSEILLDALNSESDLPEELIFQGGHIDPQMIGSYISAIANSAAMKGSEFGLLVWGIDPQNGSTVGTDFDPGETFHEGIQLENWLRNSLSNDANFEFTTLDLDGLQLVALEILMAENGPIQFQGRTYFLEDGVPFDASNISESLSHNGSDDAQDEPSSDMQISEFGANDRPILDAMNVETITEPEPSGDASESAFETMGDRSEDQGITRVDPGPEVAIDSFKTVDQDANTLRKALGKIDLNAFFDATGDSIPDSESAISEALEKAGVLEFSIGNGYSITEIGALSFAKNLSEFPDMGRKRITVIRYSGNNRGGNCSKLTFDSGYACALEDIVETITKSTMMPDPFSGEPASYPSPYPTGAIRELVINAMVHQRFDDGPDMRQGRYKAPTIEVFDDRIEVSNDARIDFNLATIANANPEIGNPGLYDLFAYLGLCNHREHGWEIIIDGCEQAGMNAPAFVGMELTSLVNHCSASTGAHSAFTMGDSLPNRSGSTQNVPRIPSAADPRSVASNSAVDEHPRQVAALSLVGEPKRPSEDMSLETRPGHFGAEGFARPEASGQSAHDDGDSGARHYILPGTKVHCLAPKAQTDALLEDGGRLIVVLGLPTMFRNISDPEKRADAYWHACSLFAKGKTLTNASLKARFDLGKSQTAQISRLLRACVEEGLLAETEEDAPLKLTQYVPAWAIAKDNRGSLRGN